MNTCIPNVACRVNVFHIHDTHLRQGSLTIFQNEVAILPIMTGTGECRTPTTATYEALVSYKKYWFLHEVTLTQNLSFFTNSYKSDMTI